MTSASYPKTRALIFPAEGAIWNFFFLGVVAWRHSINFRLNSGSKWWIQLGYSKICAYWVLRMLTEISKKYGKHSPLIFCTDVLKEVRVTYCRFSQGLQIGSINNPIPSDSWWNRPHAPHSQGFRYSPMPGAAMPIRLMVTRAMPLCAAVFELPSLFPSMSLTGTPSWISLQ